MKTYTRHVGSGSWRIGERRKSEKFSSKGIESHFKAFGFQESGLPHLGSNTCGRFIFSMHYKFKCQNDLMPKKLD